jgi:hypothetical protein
LSAQIFWPASDQMKSRNFCAEAGASLVTAIGVWMVMLSSGMT